MKELTCDVQGKKTLPVTDNGLLSVDLKGGYNFNPRSRKGKPRGVVELSYKVFNFTEDQDLKFKIGCNVFKQVSVPTGSDYCIPQLFCSVLWMIILLM